MNIRPFYLVDNIFPKIERTSQISQEFFDVRQNLHLNFFYLLIFIFNFFFRIRVIYLFIIFYGRVLIKICFRIYIFFSIRFYETFK